MTHGVFSSRRAEEIADEVELLAEDVADRFPWTRAYRDERLAYARALIDERCIRVYLDRVGMLTANANERPAVRTLERFSNRAARCRAALGLSPMAHARLLSLVAEVVRLHGGRDGPLEGSLDVLLSEGRASLLRASESEVATDAVDVDSQMPDIGYLPDDRETLSDVGLSEADRVDKNGSDLALTTDDDSEDEP